MRTRTTALRLLLVLALPLAPGCNCGGDDDGDLDAPPPVPDAPPDASLLPDGPDGDALATPDAPSADAMPVMSITSIYPPAASRYLTTDLTITGAGILPGATLVLSNCDTSTPLDLSASVVVATDGLTLEAVLPENPAYEQGLYTVTVTNPTGQGDVLECAFRILAQTPPVVDVVIPPSAYAGVAGDGVQSDEMVTIQGSGFVSTPAVRWVKTDGSVSYEALMVGYVSDTELTAVTPSETLHMVPGDYHVWVINPDLLGGQWQVPDPLTSALVPGIFTVVGTPPPTILDVDPGRWAQADCTTPGTFTITGGGFMLDATAWYLAPPGTVCAGSSVDPSGNVLCPLVVESVSVDGTTIVFHFPSCSAGAWPIVVVNPDGQSDYYFSLSLTNSSDNHLNNDDFVIIPGVSLGAARYRHASGYGFDSFGNAYIYAAGGQGATGAVLTSVETSQLNIFGSPGPFFEGMQYFGPDVGQVRAPNVLTTGRTGATMVRAGRDLFLLGGAAAPTDVAGFVDSLDTVERARILSYDEMPGVHLPAQVAPDGLPIGAWYYRVSALGPWGESLPSREVVALNARGQIEVCWDPPAGATGYNVYRSLAADGRANSAALLAINVPGPCFVDTGLDGYTPAPGNLRGDEQTGTGLVAGTYSYRVSAVGAFGETHAGYAAAVEVTSGTGAAVKLVWDPLANATAYRLYRLDAATGEFLLLDTGGDLAAPTFVDDGAAFATPETGPLEEIAPLPPGSLSRWAEITQRLLSKREGLDGVFIALELDPALPPPRLAGRIIVAGGRHKDPAADAYVYLRTAESLGVYEDGTLEPAFELEAPILNLPRAYFALLTTQDRNMTPFPPPPEEPPCGDMDGDGHIDCACAPAGTVDPDCNDADPNVHPGATEICGDGIDQDCELGCSGTDQPCGPCTTDEDLDTHVSQALCGGDDCCDSGAEPALGCSDANAPGMHPGATEICANGIDENCDGIDPPCDCTTDADGDGFLSRAAGCGDDCCDTGADTSLGCTDATAAGINPGATEICSNGIDDDCDGYDSLCKAPPGVTGVPIDLVGDEPVYVIAIFGDEAYQASANQGLDNYESCLVGPDAHLVCDDGVVATPEPDWVAELEDNPQSSFAMDAVLYFDAMYPFFGVDRESIAARSLVSSGVQRHNLFLPAADPPAVDVQILGPKQGVGGAQFFTKRGYYQMLRLMAYIYVVGGWSDTGPVGTIERHQQ